MNEIVHATDSAEFIVSLIREGDPRGEELLYSVLSRGMKFLALHKLGPEDGLECFHDTIVVLIRRIREGSLQEPAALFGYARTILLRAIMEQFEKRRRFSKAQEIESLAQVIPDGRLRPDQVLEANQRVAAMRASLLSLRPKEREILTRFYLQEQSQETIQQEMDLTETQYRLLKSRSKQKLERITRKTISVAKPKFGADEFSGSLSSPSSVRTASRGLKPFVCCKPGPSGTSLV